MRIIKNDARSAHQFDGRKAIVSNRLYRHQTQPSKSLLNIWVSLQLSPSLVLRRDCLHFVCQRKRLFEAVRKGIHMHKEDSKNTEGKGELNEKINEGRKEYLHNTGM